MSVFKRGKYYYTDFIVNGVRTCKSTKQTNKTLALKIEQELRKQQKVTVLFLSSALEQVYINRWQHTSDGLKSYKRVLTIIRLYSDIDLNDITSTTIDEIRQVLRENLSITESTINRYIANLRTVLRENNINVRCRITKEVPEKEFVFSPELEQQVLEAIRQSSLKYTRELSFLFPILIDTGMRLSECLSLTSENVLDNYQYIELFSRNCKASNPRVIPLTERAGQLLKTVITENMFEGLSNYTFSKLFKKFSPYTLHTCRHTFASRLGQSNCSALQLQYLLGHKSIKTTTRYTHFLHRENLKALFLN
jgi:integrase